MQRFTLQGTDGVLDMESLASVCVLCRIGTTSSVNSNNSGGQKISRKKDENTPLFQLT